MSTLNNEKQKDPVEDAINALKNILNTIADILSKMNLDELVQLYSKKIDAEILKTVKETGWVYRGGAVYGYIRHEGDFFARNCLILPK